MASARNSSAWQPRSARLITASTARFGRDWIMRRIRGGGREPPAFSLGSRDRTSFIDPARGSSLSKMPEHAASYALSSIDAGARPTDSVTAEQQEMALLSSKRTPRSTRMRKVAARGATRDGLQRSGATEDARSTHGSQGTPLRFATTAAPPRPASRAPSAAAGSPSCPSQAAIFAPRIATARTGPALRRLLDRR
jgi:hypothetical protein